MERIKKNFYFVVIGLIFLLAFVLRVKTYLLGRILWLDECALAQNILEKNFWDFFQPMANSQKAPFIFMKLSKLVTEIGGINELSLRFIPFICGVFSIFVFYLLSKDTLKTKFAIIMSNLLFAINYELIYYSQEFKQYSWDVLLFISYILILSKLDLNQISYKKCIMYSLFLPMTIFLSFPCVFVVGAYFILSLFNNQNKKKMATFFLPTIIVSFIYYLCNLQSNDIPRYLKYWNTGFLKFNINSIIMCFRENFNFFFAPNKFILLGLILFIIGTILMIKTKKRIVGIIFLSLFLVILASVLQIYPMWQRVALYLLPVIILIMAKPLDLIGKQAKIASLMVLILFCTYFSGYNFHYLHNFFTPNIFLRNDALATFPKLVERYDDKDILIVNSSTKSDYIYYSYRYGFKPKQVVLAVITQYDKPYYYKVLNSLPKGYTYWFIYGWENSISKHLDDYVKEFHLKTLESYTINGSRLIKVKF